MSFISKRKLMVRVNMEESEAHISKPKKYFKKRIGGHEEDKFVRYEEMTDDCWSNKFYYLLFCTLLGNGTDVFPMSINLAFHLSGGLFRLRPNVLLYFYYKNCFYRI